VSQSRSGSCGEEKDVLHLPGIETWPSSLRPIAVSTKPSQLFSEPNIACILKADDRLCGLVVRVLGYRSGGPGSITGTTKKKVVGLERDPLSLVSTTEEILDRKVAAPV
jgi:hypothetical protein